MAFEHLLNLRGVSYPCVSFSFLFRRLFVSLPMNSKGKSSYEEAVYALNGLQSNALVLQKAQAERSANADRNITNTIKHLKTLGIEIKDLDELNVVHVSGTKGKGSTCAFTESIIRHHGFKTGFYSSPHLISVNERIRINGQPLKKELFAEYFWEVYKTIHNSLINEETMPPYFLFLTVMAFYVFMKEKVQAAIIEVGIGGLYDCTNIISKPVAIGVSSLGLDHVKLLGNTIEEIAEQKAGIFKQDVPVFTVPQNKKAMYVLQNKALSKNCSLQLSPHFDFYQKSSNSFTLGVPGIVQNLNASLALQLSKAWLDKKLGKNTESGEIITKFSIENSVPMATPFDLNNLYEKGLQLCSWPGRFQILELNKITFYFDGAHTQQSMKYTAKWFEESSAEEHSKLNNPVLKILLFNLTSERKAEAILGPLSDLHFDIVLFSPNRISVMKDSSSDQSNFMVDPETEMQQCITNKEIWCHLKNSMYENELNSCAQALATSSVTVQNMKANDPSSTRSLLFPCLNDAMNFLVNCENSHSPNNPTMEECVHLIQSSTHIQVLVTGSLHLVGGVLSIVQTV